MSSRERAVDAINRAIDEGSGSVDQFSIAWDAISWIESAGLQIVPANLLDAVIAAVDEAFCYNPVTKRSKIQVARTDVIAAIRAAWEGGTDPQPPEPTFDPMTAPMWEVASKIMEVTGEAGVDAWFSSGRVCVSFEPPGCPRTPWCEDLEGADVNEAIRRLCARVTAAAIRAAWEGATDGH